jgi:hypothetical protein
MGFGPKPVESLEIPSVLPFCHISKENGLRNSKPKSSYLVYGLPLEPASGNKLVAK